jgi:cytosine/adenosine deaminase-related metal-dependent hydrolase
VLSQSGIRAISGKVMMDHGDEVPSALMEKTEASLQESVDLLEKWHGFDHGRIQYAFSPRFVVSCTEELLTSVRDLSNRYNVKMHTHALISHGIHVGIGADGAPCNNNLDMYQEMRLTALIQKDSMVLPYWMPAQCFECYYGWYGNIGFG